MAKRKSAPKASVPKTNDAPRDPYASKKIREHGRQAENSRQGRDIGPPPPVADPARRAKAERSFRAFCETYFRETRFSLSWSHDHLKVIDRIEETVQRGGLFAMAMPRGSGKTSLSEVGAMWALFTGARKFVALIGASAAAAEENLDSIKQEIEVNELLAEDFPEVCYPIRMLEGSAQLCARQLSLGERTRISYGKRVLVLPTIPNSKAAGGILRVAGITGRIRGMKYVRSDGMNVRPDLAIVDDPQTDKSADSERDSAKREKVLAGAILGLAGPGKKIAAVMPCTVIRRGDMADNILDRTKHPRWHGERMKAVYRFPTNEKLWDEYAEIRAASMRNGGTGAEGTAFYKKNRKAMDAGAEVAWPDRFEEGELSGLQHAMNLRFDDERAFMAERQQEPASDMPEDSELLTVEQIARKVNGIPRRVVPNFATRLTTFIDVQHRLLFYAVAAWADDFTGAVVDYGTWPEQPRSNFVYRSVRTTLQTKYPRQSTQGCVIAGLEDLCNSLFTRRWATESGTEIPIERGLADAADGNVTDAVFDFCRNGAYRSFMLPAIGKGIGPTDTPMHAYKPKPGERLGFHWLAQPVPKRACRQVIVDANFWKSFVNEGLAIGQGDKRCLSLFGDRQTDHRLFAAHLTAEYRQRAKNERTQRVVDVWQLKPAKPDNHWLDCFAGCAVAASLQGASVMQRSGAKPKSQPAAASTPKRPVAAPNVTYL